MISLNEEQGGKKELRPDGFPPIPAKPDTANHFIVGVSEGMFVIQRTPRGYLTREQCINLAAWLIALADPTTAEFARVLQEIKKS